MEILNARLPTVANREYSISVFYVLLLIPAFLLGLLLLSASAPLKSTPNDKNILKMLNHDLVEAENKKDTLFARKIIWKSPNALFVAKTATDGEGGWAGFWGAKNVEKHINDVLRDGTFKIYPEYAKEKIVLLRNDIGETYLPVKLGVSYGGQNPTPTPFLLIIEWLKIKNEWKMASDIAIPVPANK